MKNLTLSKTEFINIKDLSNLRILQAFYKAALTNNLPVAVWKMPNDINISCLISLSDVEQKNIDFKTQEPSFVFSPFINKDSQINYILKQDILLDLNKKEITYDETSENIKLRDFIESFNKFIQEETINNQWFISDNDINDRSYSKEEFCHFVSDAVNDIKSGNTKKIVVSRKFDIQLSERFDIIINFDKLVRKYENAFTSLVSIPKIGTWMGATPETLLKINDNEIITMSLAGTQPKPENNNLSEIKWNKKEIEEQSFVSEFIRECFKKSGAENFEEEEPKTSDAGKFVHLRTIFKYCGDNLKDISTEFLRYMHPTPAVCGLPKNKALAFLLKNEIHNREFYSGFLGPVNIDKTSALFVNLRCMKLKDKQAVIYVGCGITADSQPEKEWEETQLKSQILLSVINNE